jgi:hypothetical protein
VSAGLIDIGKRLRPNIRRGRIVLFVAAAAPGAEGSAAWQAVKLP